MATLRFIASTAVLLVFMMMAFVASAASGPNDHRSTSAHSAAERALFGSSYAEDCLFGSSSQLFGAPAATTKVKEDDYTIPAKAVVDETPIKKKNTRDNTSDLPAFVNNNPPTAFVYRNHH